MTLNGPSFTNLILTFIYTSLQLDLGENELIIYSTVIDKDNFSILTTRRLLTSQNGQLSLENIQGATDRMYGILKVIKTKLLLLDWFNCKTAMN